MLENAYTAYEQAPFFRRFGQHMPFVTSRKAGWRDDVLLAGPAGNREKE